MQTPIDSGIAAKKVLIITYYWPPSGGSGVQRWLKFVKYLPQYGYTPYVFTPENPSFELKDESLLKDVPSEAEVIHFPIWEPYGLLPKKKSSAAEKSSQSDNVGNAGKNSFLMKIAKWVRANLIIPDPRVFWVRSSVQFLNDFIADNDISTIITTGPPHSIHLIGLGLKKKSPGIKWIADFRDPWSEWGFLDSLGVSPLSRRIHKYLEKRVFRFADTLLTITPFYQRQFSALSNKPVKLITNGFDEDDFAAVNPQRTNKFVIRHVGIVNEKCDPRSFIQAVETLMQRSPAFKENVIIDFVGDVNSGFKSFVKERSSVSDVTSFTAPLPHSALLKLYNETSLLLLVLAGYKDAEGYMPGKLFEYAATGLPVLGIGPEQGDAARMMDVTKIGSMIESTDIERIVTALGAYFERWQKKESALNKDSKVQQFSRRGLTAKLVELF